MEAFNNFSLTTPESIVGGKLISTAYEGEDGTTGNDWYDTTHKRIVYQ